MRSQYLSRPIVTLTISIVAVLLLVGANPIAEPSLAGPALVQEGSLTVASPLLHFQGRLLDPATGNPKPNGVYGMTFRLYNLAVGGTALWSEAKSVVVENGLFDTFLGDTAALNIAHFDGSDLWLGVTVGADPEAVPRQRVAHVAYALYAVNAGFARDADQVDGRNASDFALASHAHNAADIQSGNLANARFSAFSDLAEEGKIGSGASQVAAGDHQHDARYVNANGDTMTGDLTVPRVNYSAPHVQYFIVGSEGFAPGSNVDYTNTYGCGGAYLSSGSGAMAAPVHLPHGARITALQVFFDDTTGSNMNVTLSRQFMTSCGYATLAEVDSGGISGYGNKTTTDIAAPIVDNTAYSYHVRAWSTGWNNSLMIKGALITYEISAAP